MAKATQTKKVITRKAQSHLNREKTQRKYLLTGISIVLVLIFAVIGFGLVHEFALKPQEPVARVGEQSISTKEFQTRVRYQRWQTIQQYISTVQQSQMFSGNEGLTSYFSNSLNQIAAQLDDYESLGNNVLDQMIDEVVIIQEATARGYSISESDVDEKIETLFGYYAKGTPTTAPTTTVAVTSTYSPTQVALLEDMVSETATAFPTEEITNTPEPDAEEEIDEAGATAVVEPSPYPSSTPITFEGFQEMKTGYFDQLTDVGFNENDLRSMVKANLLQEKLFDDVTSDAAKEEERVWARHILVEDKETALEVTERLDDGEDFAALASEFSTDTSNKDSGGDLGWFPRGQMVAEFEEAAFDLKIGEISQVVESSFGFHIIQVLGHEVQPLSDSELQAARQNIYDEWFAQLKSEKDIETFDRWKDRVPVEPTISPEMLGVSY